MVSGVEHADIEDCESHGDAGFVGLDFEVEPTFLGVGFEVVRHGAEAELGKGRGTWWSLIWRRSSMLPESKLEEIMVGGEDGLGEGKV